MLFNFFPDELRSALVGNGSDYTNSSTFAVAVIISLMDSVIIKYDHVLNKCS